MKVYMFLADGFETVEALAPIEVFRRAGVEIHTVSISGNIEVSREALRHWAGQFADIVKVVSPPELVEEIRQDIRKAAENYGI